MRFRSLISFPVLIVMIACMQPALLPLRAQDRKASLDQTIFSEAVIKWDRNTLLPKDIIMDAAGSGNEDEFISHLRTTFGIPPDLEFIHEKESTGPHGMKHIRYAQYYKGIELARTPYILHLNKDQVVHAHGQLPGEPLVDLHPALSKEEAYEIACNHLGMNVTEARKNESWISRLSMDENARREDGKLWLSTGYKERKPEHYSLVYCFDITTTTPLGRYDVEIDAHSGELVGKYPTLYHENIPTTGTSLYNDTVPIVVSDTIFKNDWPDDEAYWHLDEWNAYQSSGSSWWMSDTANFTPGGYSNIWYVVLETDPIEVTGMLPLLAFHHRYALEDPDGASDYNRNYDGWDGINVRISTNDGDTWEVLTAPAPAYTCTSLWSFGDIHSQGPGIPGWAGRQERWTPVSFDLSAYLGETIRIRFDFASDAGYASEDDNSLFGWQIDDIEVRNDNEILYSNLGSDSNIRPYTISNWVGRIEGKYRLRETTRGQGIATINAESGLGYTSYVDFVQDTFPIMSTMNRAGVSVHWASASTYDYYQDNYGRNSYDNQGGKIISYVDWIEDDDRNNAFWVGSFAAYGAGDGVSRGSFGAIDVVGHEISHGLTEHTANLVYQGESGALNESFSDIFGAAIEFYAEGRDKGEWLIGEDVYLGLGSIRSMQDPKVRSHPDTYLGEHWLDTKLTQDNGGVHINSGVQNHWFYLLSEGGTGENDDGIAFQVSGIGLDDASQIAYRNLTNYLLPHSRYVDAAYYSIQAAEDLFGMESQQVQSTRSAWEAVGIYMDSRLMTSDTVLEFESLINDSEHKYLRLINRGIEALSITAFNFTDPDIFALQPPQSLPLQLNGGDSLRLWIVFSPEMEGTYEDSLTIESSDPLRPAQTIRLSALAGNDATGLPETKVDGSGLELAVGPNPFHDRLLITYTLPRSEHITIEIRDITGKLLYQSSRQASGKESIEIIWGNIPGPSRTSSGGIYLLSLHTSTGTLVKKIVKR